MRYVIIRDDDTNVLTPPDCLEKLYRPFLDAGFPVNLATIPAVSPDVKRPDGQPESFVARRNGFEPVVPAHGADRGLALTRGQPLVEYLRENPGYHLVQHGCHHDPFEFDSPNRDEVIKRLELGRQIFAEAGFPIPTAFVAPHDKFSRISYQEVARRFSVISTGWFEWGRLPHAWWPRYAMVKALKQPHWRLNGTSLLTHPGCLLSYMRPYGSMLESIQSQIAQQRLTVLVTHWWEYFRENEPDDAFIGVLHSVAEYLKSEKTIKVISFADLAQQQLALN